MQNIEVFTKQIQPLLKSKTKTAYLLVDALRFELAKELEENIEKHFSVQINPSCAYLPTVTKYGMAALLPDADKDLILKEIVSLILKIFRELLLFFIVFSVLSISYTLSAAALPFCIK